MSFTAAARSCQAGSLASTRSFSGPARRACAALLADEVDHLGAVDRRVLHELQLHRLVRGVDARHAERPRGDAHPVALEQRARRLGQLAEAVDELLAQRVELLARRRASARRL